MASFKKNSTDKKSKIDFQIEQLNILRTTEGQVILNKDNVEILGYQVHNTLYPNYLSEPKVGPIGSFRTAWNSFINSGVGGSLLFSLQCPNNGILLL